MYYLCKPWADSSSKRMLCETRVKSFPKVHINNIHSFFLIHKPGHPLTERDDVGQAGSAFPKPMLTGPDSPGCSVHGVWLDPRWPTSQTEVRPTEGLGFVLPFLVKQLSTSLVNFHIMPLYKEKSLWCSCSKHLPISHLQLFYGFCISAPN